ncbi:MAG TPA: hypothetical protein VN924_14880 [Bryobacteraceae bacterium]|jgi:uncharacterized protein YukE|nr:hypothetical protein [Bryobacteraceae bacterium]
MTHEEQIAEVQARLDAANQTIAQLNAELEALPLDDFDGRATKSAQISQWTQTAETLQTMLNNLGAAPASAASGAS